MISAPLPPLLPDDLLAQRTTLPRKPAPVTLTGKIVRLEPFDPARDNAALYAISNGQPFSVGARHIDTYDADDLIWRWMNGGAFAAQAEFDAYMQRQLDAADGLPFTVFDLTLNHPVGVANFMANVPEHLKIELGSIWYSPIAQGTGANADATYLMLEHAFALGYQRVEWKCNALNERSRRAALRMGFTFEGIQDAHYIVKGRRRDTAWFRMLADEWDGVRTALDAIRRAGSAFRG
ncbi:MAG: GNAT family protein [Chloroflexota bacterium]|nr:GNAT family protein [Chloroflexota bacterium]